MKATQFKMLYGCDPPRLVHYEQGGTQVSYVDAYLAEWDRMLEVFREHLKSAQDVMKAMADEKQLGRI